jgi:putative acetyltransferase
MITIRPESAADLPLVRRILEEAFEQPDEADLVDLLRERGKLTLALVAEEGGQPVGHLAMSPVSVDSAPQLHGLGLGPMAVLPERQNQGIGSLLARAALEECRRLGTDYAVVLGHPEYYPRFGFAPAGRFGLHCVWPVPEGVFMALELRPGALAGCRGLVRYQPEFDVF